MGIFGGAPKPDYSAINQQKAQLAKQEAELEEQERQRAQREAASIRARSGSSRGGDSLLTGLETGVAPVTGRSQLG